MKRLTTEKFITKASQIHNDLFNYQNVNYINNYTKIDIICKKHGVFQQRPFAHLKGQGCPFCKTEKQKSNTYEFIKKSRKIHQNKYNYSLVKYITAQTKVQIICPQHGIFNQQPYSHLQGDGCFACNGKRRLTTKQFIQKAKKIHKNKYLYSETNYINAYTHINIICPKHGIFNQQPYSHLDGRGCPVCKESKGEKKIRTFLSEKNIKFQNQYRFPNCRSKYTLPFDFAIFDNCNNLILLIEYHGIQHYKPCSFGSSQKSSKILYTELKLRDKIKLDFCTRNKITLIIISYLENIDNLLISLGLNNE